MGSDKKTESEEKIVIGSDLDKKVNCSNCGKEGNSNEFFRMQNNKGEEVYLCSDCKTKLNEDFAKETKNPRIPTAILGGIAGALLGAILWYAVAVIFEIEIGYISLALGWLVGQGVYLGAGKKRGIILQLIAVVIVILSIILTEKFVVEYFVNQYLGSIEAGSEYYTVSLTQPEFWESFVSPIGLIIYALGVYISFSVLKPKKI